jgi:hypothetical protein
MPKKNFLIKKFIYETFFIKNFSLYFLNPFFRSALLFFLGFDTLFKSNYFDKSFSNEAKKFEKIEENIVSCFYARCVVFKKKFEKK